MDVFILISDLEGLSVVSLALADLARDVYIGEEVHLDLHDAVALAGFAAPALDVEGETVCLVAALFCVGRGGEKIADIVEYSRVGGGI